MVERYLPGARTVEREPTFAEFGPLAEVMSRPNCTDVVLNGEQVWVDAGAGFEPVTVWFDEPVDQYVRNLIAQGGRHIDEVTPIADVRLGEVRVHAVLPPISTGGPLLSLRIARPARFTLHELVSVGTLSQSQSLLLTEATRAGASVLVSGSTGSGKTTLLRALCGDVDASKRIVTIEDVAELQVPHPHVVSLEARQANLEGAGSIALSDLVRAALRMRPDWLVVGECRGAEIREFLAALNTGHQGGGTVHANSIHDVAARLEALGALAGLSELALARQVASAFRYVVHLERTASGRSAVIAKLSLRNGQLHIDELAGETDVSDRVV